MKQKFIEVIAALLVTCAIVGLLLVIFGCDDKPVVDDENTNNVVHTNSWWGPKGW